MKRTLQFLTMLVMLTLMSAPAWATTRNVPSASYPTIQAAVDAAVGGDEIVVAADYNPTGNSAKVSIPAGKNGLIIRGLEDGGNRPTLDGTAASYPKIGFQISSDDVTISGFEIIGFNGTVAPFDTWDFVSYNGAAIYATFNMTNLNIYDNIIRDCNWGILLPEPVGCNIHNNDISNLINIPTIAPATHGGGVGIMVWSDDAEIEYNFIYENTISYCPVAGIWLGTDNAANVSADLTEIYSNTISNVSYGVAPATVNDNIYAIVIKNIIGSLEIVDNNFLSNANCIDLQAFNALSCEDVTIYANNFAVNENIADTNATTFVRTDAFFSGEKLYDVWRTLGNYFDNGDPTSYRSAVAARDIMNEEIGFTPAGKRYIRNHVVKAIEDANGFYMCVEALPGIYKEGPYNVIGKDFLTIRGVTIGANTAQIKSEDLNKQGSFAAMQPALIISSDNVSIYNLDFLAEVNTNGAFFNSSIFVNGANCYIYENRFIARPRYATSTIYPLVAFNNSGLSIERNQFITKSPSLGNYYGIYVAPIAAGTGTMVINENTFTGNFINGITVNGTPDNTYFTCNEFVKVAADPVANEAILFNDLAVLSNINIFGTTITAAPGKVVTGMQFGTATSSFGFAGTNFVRGSRIDNATNGIVIFINPETFAVDENWLAGSYTYAVWNQAATGTLKAANNYWNCVNGPVADGSSYTSPLGDNCIGTAVEGDINYSPWLNSGVDMDPAICGFQPDLSTSFGPVYISDDMYGDEATPIPNERKFPSIKAAVDAIALFPGYRTVIALPGTYAEQRTVINYPAPINIVAKGQTTTGINYDPTLTTIIPSFSMTHPETMAPGADADAWYLVQNAGIAFVNFTVSENDETIYEMLRLSATATGMNMIFGNVFNTGINEGIYNLNTGAVIVGNVFNGNYAYQGFGATASSVFQENIFNGNGYTVFFLDGSNGNTVVNNKFTATTHPAITVGSNVAAPSNALIGQNDFSGVVGTAVVVGFGATDVSTASIMQNNFAATSTALNVNNAPGTVVAATENWFGSNNGPTTAENTFNVGNQGATIVDNNMNADFTPWWVEPTNIATTVKPGDNYTGTVWGPVYLYTSGVTRQDCIDHPEYFYPNIQSAFDDINLVGLFSPVDEPYVYLAPTEYPETTAVYTEKVIAPENGNILHLDRFNGQTIVPTVTSTVAAGPTMTIQAMHMNIGGDAADADGYTHIRWENAAAEPVIAVENDVTFFTEEYFYNNEISSNGPATHGIFFADHYDAGLVGQYYQVTIGNNDFYFDGNDQAVFNEIGVNLSSTNAISVEDNNFLVNNPVVPVAANIAAINWGNVTTQLDIKKNVLPVVVKLNIVNATPNGLDPAYYYIWNNWFTENLSTDANADGVVFSYTTSTPATDIFPVINFRYNLFDGRRNGIAFDGTIQTMDLFSANNIVVNDNNFKGLDNTLGQYAITFDAAIELSETIPTMLDLRFNYWGNNNGPRTMFGTITGNSQKSLNTFNFDGQTATVHVPNTYDVIAITPWMNNANEDWRNTIVGNYWAPIWRNTNPVTGSSYANFFDAIAATLGESIRVANGTYTENIDVNQAGLDIEGRILANTVNMDDGGTINGYAVIDNATASFTVNTVGAADNAPVLYNDNVTAWVAKPSPERVMAISNNDINVQGFVFNTTNGTNGNAIYMTGAIDNFDMANCEFEMNDIDHATYVVSGSNITNSDFTYNEYDGSASTNVAATPFALRSTAAAIAGLQFTDNVIIHANTLVLLGNANVLALNISENDFSDNFGAIRFDANVGATGLFQNIDIRNNNFFDNAAKTTDYAVQISANVVNANVANWATDFEIVNNNLTYPATHINVIDLQTAAPATSITATCNWWGTADGPTNTSNVGGTVYGAPVSANVQYAKWLSSDLHTTDTPGFFPTGACDGWWVYSVNAEDPSAPDAGINNAKYFGKLQLAITDAATLGNQYIYVKNTANLDEDITFNTKPVINLYAYPSPTSDMVHVAGIAATNGTTNVNLGSDVQFSDIHMPDAVTLYFSAGTSKITLNDYDLRIAGKAFAGNANTNVVTNGEGSLVIYEAKKLIDYVFPVAGPVATSGQYTPVTINLQNAALPTNNELAVRTNNSTNPVGLLGWGEPTNPILSLWNIKGPENANANVTFRYPAALRQVGFNLNMSYAARWKDVLLNDAEPNKWATHRPLSFSNGSDGTLVQQVNDMTPAGSPWAIFWGPSSYATSSVPYDQARNIMFVQATDTQIKLRWTNGSGQRRVVVAREEDPEPNDLAFIADLNARDGKDYGSVTPIIKDATSIDWAVAPTSYTTADSKIIYDGVAPEITVTGLTSGAWYKFQVCEYNGTLEQVNYNTDAGLVANPRHRKTMPACTLSVATVPVASNPLYDNIKVCSPATTYLRFDFTGSPGSGGIPNGWKLKYSDESHTNLITPNPWVSPYFHSVTGPTGARVYKMVSAFDGDLKICKLYHAGNGTGVVIERHEQTNGSVAPATQTVCENGTVNLTATFNSGFGYETPVFKKWQYSMNAGSTWADYAGATSEALSFVAPLSLDGAIFRGVFSTSTICAPAPIGDLAIGEIASTNTAAITVQQASAAGTVTAFAPTCETTPNVTLEVSVPAMAQAPAQTIQWEESTDGVAFTPIAGATTATYVIPTPATSMYYRAVFTHGVCASVASAAEFLRIDPTTVAGGVSQTESPYVRCQNFATPVEFTAATAAPVVGSIVRWERRFNGGAWEAIASTDAVLSVPSASVLATGTYEFQAIYQSGACSALASTSMGTLVVNPGPQAGTDTIADNHVCANQMAPVVFTKYTDGTIGTMTWQYSADGLVWNNVSGVITVAQNQINVGPVIPGRTDLLITPTVPNALQALDDYQFRVSFVTGGCDVVYSDVATLTVNIPPTVTEQPAPNVTVCQNGVLTLTATGSAVPVPVPHWEYSTNSGSTWNPVNGMFGATYPYHAPVGASIVTEMRFENTMIEINGFMFRAVFVDNDGKCPTAISNSCVVSVNPLPGLATNINVTDRHNTYFTVNWSVIGTGNTYDVEVYDNETFTGSPVTAVYGYASTSWETDHNLQPSNSLIGLVSNYWVRVRVNTLTCGSSTWVGKTTPDATTNPQVQLAKVGFTTFADEAFEFGFVPQGTASATQYLSVIGSELDNPVVFTMPQFTNGSFRYEARQEGTATWFRDFVTIAPNASGAINTRLEIRFAPTLADCDIAPEAEVIGVACTNVTTFDYPEGYNNFVNVSGAAVVGAPTTQASNVTFTADNGNNITVTCVPGNGTRRMIVGYKGATNPAAWFEPLVNTDYPLGQIGTTDFYVLADIDAATATVNVDAGTVYWFKVFEYNSCGANKNYNINNNTNNPMMPKYFVVANAEVDAANHTPMVGEVFAVTVGSLDRAGAVIDGDDEAAFEVRDNNPISTLHFNTGNIAVGTSSTLLPDFYINNSFDGYDNVQLTAHPTNAPTHWLQGQPNVAPFNVWAKEPNVQARTINWIGAVPCSTLTISWVRGKNNLTNTHSLVVANNGTTPAIPNDWTLYPAQLTNAVDFTSAPFMNEATSNTKLLYKGDLNQITVNGLQGNNTYYFRIYAYNGSLTSENVNFNTYTGSYNPRPRTMPACRENSDLEVSLAVENYAVRSGSSKAIAGWKTNFQHNISGFEVYRLDNSDDQAEFVKVGTYAQNSELAGQGYSDDEKSYNFVDNSSNLVVGNTYTYQLLAIGIDGSRYEVQEESVTISAEELPVVADEFQVSDIKASPVVNDINFDVTLSQEQSVKIEIIDMTGLVVNKSVRLMHKGINNVTDLTDRKSVV